MADLVSEQPDELIDLLVDGGARCGEREFAGCTLSGSCTLLGGGELCIHGADSYEAEQSSGTPMYGGVALAFVVALGLWSCRRR